MKSAFGDWILVFGIWPMGLPRPDKSGLAMTFVSLFLQRTLCSSKVYDSVLRRIQCIK